MTIAGKHKHVNRSSSIFVLTISENVQLNCFDTRMLKGVSKITEVGVTGRDTSTSNHGPFSSIHVTEQFIYITLI